MTDCRGALARASVRQDELELTEVSAEQTRRLTVVATAEGKRADGGRLNRANTVQILVTFQNKSILKNRGEELVSSCFQPGYSSMWQDPPSYPSLLL